jgi:putative endonuclease
MYYVYILSNPSNTTLYTGVTNNLTKRTWEHKSKIYLLSFTSKYKTFKLVYYEAYNDIKIAIQREKQLKRWKRKWKREIISKFNPTWSDLSIIDKGNILIDHLK